MPGADLWTYGNKSIGSGGGGGRVHPGWGSILRLNAEVFHGRASIWNRAKSRLSLVRALVVAPSNRSVDDFFHETFILKIAHGLAPTLLGIGFKFELSVDIPNDDPDVANPETIFSWFESLRQGADGQLSG